MENLETFRQSLENSHRQNDTNQTIKEVAYKLEKAKTELSQASTALADLMNVADEGNCKSCLVFLAELRATTIAAYNTINTAENELINRGGCQKRSKTT